MLAGETVRSGLIKRVVSMHSGISPLKFLNCWSQILSNYLLTTSESF